MVGWIIEVAVVDKPNEDTNDSDSDGTLSGWSIVHDFASVWVWFNG